MKLKKNLMFMGLITAGMFIACNPTSNGDSPDPGQVSSVGGVSDPSGVDPNNPGNSSPVDPFDPNNPGDVNNPGDPSSSSAGVSNASGVSSSTGVSSSVVQAPVCNRTSTDFEFLFRADSVILGHQTGVYPQAFLTDGSLVVTAGDPCEDAQEVRLPKIDDNWNLYFKEPWSGRTGDRIKIDVITWSNGTPNTPDTGTSSSTQTSSSSEPVAGAIAGWLTEELYNKAFPKRNPFYTWASFVQAYNELKNITEPGDFADFLNEGSLETKKREAAAFFANIVQETGTQTWDSGLHYIKETCAATGVPSGNCTGYNSSAPNYYYGRGPMQLSWNYNYQYFSEAIYGSASELLYNPDKVSSDAKVAWLAAMWFWNRSDYSYSYPPPTIHDIMVGGKSFGGSSGFGGTIKVINGGLECPSWGNPKAQNRINFYSSMQGVFGVSPDTENLNCS